MKPFKPKRREDKKLLSYKRLFLTTLFMIMCYAWYQASDEISVNTNNKETAEVN